VVPALSPPPQRWVPRSTDVGTVTRRIPTAPLPIAQPIAERHKSVPQHPSVAPRLLSSHSYRDVARNDSSSSMQQQSRGARIQHSWSGGSIPQSTRALLGTREEMKGHASAYRFTTEDLSAVNWHAAITAVIPPGSATGPPLPTETLTLSASASAPAIVATEAVVAAAAAEHDDGDTLATTESGTCNLRRSAGSATGLKMDMMMLHVSTSRTCLLAGNEDDGDDVGVDVEKGGGVVPSRRLESYTVTAYNSAWIRLLDDAHGCLVKRQCGIDCRLPNRGRMSTSSTRLLSGARSARSCRRRVSSSAETSSGC
jgi:hypothetical protein